MPASMNLGREGGGLSSAHWSEDPPLCYQHSTWSLCLQFSALECLYEVLTAMCSSKWCTMDEFDAMWSMLNP